MESLLDTSEAAARLGVAPTTLIDWRYKRTGPPYVRVSHRLIRYKEVDLQKWIDRHLVKPGADR